MVNMSHHRYNRWTWYPVFFIIFIFIRLDCFNYIRTNVFRLEAKFFSNNINRFRIQTLIDRNHDANTHTSSNDFRNRDIHHVGQIVCSNEFRQLQDFAFLFLLFHQFMLTLLDSITLIPTIFSTFIALIVLICQSG